MRPQQRGGGSRRMRVLAASASGTLVGALCVVGAVAPGMASARPAHQSDHGPQCRLANGIRHVVQIGFDNVHFFRDNPNVPSDLQQIPSLLHFVERNGVMLSNNHTPLIAHTADDLLTTQTGLYGDRQGEPVSNTYQAYNADGTTDKADSFTYWTDAIDDEATHPNAGHDTNPNMVYSPVPPATASSPVAPTTVTPAPWVSYTRAGCNVGEVATVNQELENPVPDISEVFGANSPEQQEVSAFSDQAPFYDNPLADYVGLGVHCARSSALCGNAEAVKFGQTALSHTAVTDTLADEPGGYNGFQALYGSKYLTPEIGGGSSQADATSHGVPVSDSNGNLVDEFGNTMTESFATPAGYPGFPGYGEINAAQSLSYAADMLEHGVQVVNLYIADLHGNEGITGNVPANDPGLEAACASAPDALGSGSQCYTDQAIYYNDAFKIFLKRLRADGITPKNTLFVVSSDEGDHEVGANVGRAIQPTPAGCNGVTVACNYTSSNFGELAGDLTGLLNAAGNTTPYSIEPDTAPEFYLTGNPGPDASTVRTFEKEVAGLTAPDPYTGNPAEKLANYLANPVEEGILHMVNADPARTPTLAMFANPDYFLETGSASCNPAVLGTGGCTTQDDEFAWDHGDYAAEINTNYVGFVGPGVRQLGLDGPTPSQGPNSAGANSGLTVSADYHLPGPWVDETDIRPTMMYLLGLHDDYEPDGRVITQILSRPDRALSAPGVTRLGECYKQLNSSVGDFGAATLTASTSAIESTSLGDATYLGIDSQLRSLEVARDQLAGEIKGELEGAAFENAPIFGVRDQIRACRRLIGQAEQLAAASSG
jgi:hypothetical protein